MRLGVIGCGKMGRALVGGIIASSICRAADVFVYDAYAPAIDSMVRDLGVQPKASNSEVVDASDVVLLCVKPQIFPEMLSQLGESRDRLLISIAAGIQIETIEEGCQHRHRVIRVMPNTPALVGRGASGFALGTKATPEDGRTTLSLLEAVGYACQVEEEQLDAVTSVSGSGPAYIFLMIEALIAEGVAQGLSEEIAKELATETVAGAAELLRQSEESPATLRENVTSPNGTTFAALESFREAGFTEIVRNAVAAAADRSRELGKPS
ncbi:MAG: pyrroline-5-carboxylate reductase [Verrucomicrobiales bacterium]|nr:pyrroline-5-carboxylate reductase [Verrucomicrobiales bacterium]